MQARLGRHFGVSGAVPTDRALSSLGGRASRALYFCIRTRTLHTYGLHSLVMRLRGSASFEADMEQ